jgi:HSP20 family protein
MAIMRWDPFAELDRMLDVVSGRAAGGGAERTITRGMPIDVYRVGDEYVVEMDLPGIDPSSIDIRVERNMLTVEAQAESTHQEADDVLVCERRHVRYRRQLYLGDDVDTDNVHASYDNGVLRLRIPRVKEQQARKVDVVAGEGTRQLRDETRAAQSEGQSQATEQQTPSREKQPVGQSAS